MNRFIGLSAWLSHPMAALTSESQPSVHLRPSTTVSHESKSTPELMAAAQEHALPLAKTARGSIQHPALQPPKHSLVEERPAPSESHAVARPQPSATAMLNRHSLPTLAGELEAAALAESATPQEIAAQQPMQQDGEPMLHSTARSSDQPVGTSSTAAATPSDAEAPVGPPALAADAIAVAAAPAVPVTRNEDAPPMMASRLPAVDHGSFLATQESGLNRKDELVLAKRSRKILR